jgi:hypothetical protein
MVSKADFKNLFQSPLKDILTKKYKQAKKKENTEGDDESLEMNVFEKLMEGNHTKNVNKGDDDLKSINNTNTFAYSTQNNMTDKSCLDNIIIMIMKNGMNRKRLKKIFQYNILQILL